MNGVELAKKILREEFAILLGSDLFPWTEHYFEKYIEICGIKPEMDEAQIRERIIQVGLTHSVANARLVKTYSFTQTFEVVGTVR